MTQRTFLSQLTICSNLNHLHLAEDGRKVEIRLLKKGRPNSYMQGYGAANGVHPELQKEIDFYKKLLQNENEVRNQVE